MGDLQLENFPDELRERLLRQAYKREMSLDDVILAALERQMARMEFSRGIGWEGDVESNRHSRGTSRSRKFAAQRGSLVDINVVESPDEWRYCE